MNAVYFLYHIDDRLTEGVYHQGKIVGIYSTIEKARAAIIRSRDLPGFKDFPEQWRIYRRTLNRDSWSNGFVKETHERIRDEPTG
jgi:hypothetical protein